MASRLKFVIDCANSDLLHSGDSKISTLEELDKQIVSKLEQAEEYGEELGADDMFSRMIGPLGLIIGMRSMLDFEFDNTILDRFQFLSNP